MCESLSCLTLCDPMDCSPPGSSVHAILQAMTLQWIAIPFSRDLPHPGIEPHIAGRLYHPSHQGGWYSAHSVHHSLSFPAVLPTPVSILYPCPENRFISTIFSRFHTYMLIYDICFLFLTYFSLYDRFWVHPQSALFFIFFS